MSDEHKILIITGEANNVAGALGKLEIALNNLQAEYDYINSIIVTIDKEVTSVSRSVWCYATQMIRRK